MKRNLKRTHLNDIWGEWYDTAEHFLAGNIPSGPLTVLLDEPERSFDLPSQVAVWRFIRAYSHKIQFIVASHSFYALDLPEAHYIELVPGYLDVSLSCLSHLLVWKNEKPMPKPVEAK